MIAVGSHGRWLPALLWVAGIAFGQPASSESAPTVAARPNVQIAVFFAPEMAYATALSYDRAVSREQALADLQELATGLGYDSVDDLRPSQPGAAKPTPIRFETTKDGLNVGFRLSERAFNRSIGTFKLEPFVRAFAEYGRIDLDFMVSDLNGRRFAYRGVGNWSSDEVVIRHKGQGTYHTFAIEVREPALKDFELPPFAPPVTPVGADQEGDKESDFPVEYVILVLVAAAVSLVVFAIVFYGLGRWHRGSKTRRRRR